MHMLVGGVLSPTTYAHHHSGPLYIDSDDKRREKISRQLTPCLLFRFSVDLLSSVLSCVLPVFFFCISIKVLFFLVAPVLKFVFLLFIFKKTNFITLLANPYLNIFVSQPFLFALVQNHSCRRAGGTFDCHHHRQSSIVVHRFLLI